MVYPNGLNTTHCSLNTWRYASNLVRLRKDLNLYNKSIDWSLIPVFFVAFIALHMVSGQKIIRPGTN